MAEEARARRAAAVKVFIVMLRSIVLSNWIVGCWKIFVSGRRRIKCKVGLLDVSNGRDMEDLPPQYIPFHDRVYVSWYDAKRLGLLTRSYFPQKGHENMVVL